MESSKKEFEQTKVEEQTWDILKGEIKSEAIPEEDIELYPCDHAPNLLDFLGKERRGDVVVHIYRCVCCGEDVEEVYPLTEKGIA